MKQLTLLLTILMFGFSAMATSAVTISTTTTASTVSEKKSDFSVAKTKIIEKFQQKIAKKLQKANPNPGVDFKDPVKKWLWYGLTGWVAAVALYIVSAVVGVGSVTAGTGAGLGLAGILGLIGGLVGLAGTVCFVIWLVKKFG